MKLKRNPDYLVWLVEQHDGGNSNVIGVFFQEEDARKIVRDGNKNAGDMVYTTTPVDYYGYQL
jgi:hypothetical protein